jgi:hypothetical protein
LLTDEQIINITFCGDGVDDDFNGDSQCKSYKKGCKDFVANNPTAFAESYWLFNSIKVYQQ